MRRLNIAVLQMSLREGDVEGNTARALSSLEEAGRAAAGLAVLPEMWWSGFSYRRLDELSARTEESLREIGAAAARHRMSVVGSWPEKAGEHLYNTAYVIGPDGSVRGSYRKAHLFSPMKEDRFLSPGDQVAVVEMEFGRLGLALCYDLRFPELIRSLALRGAELVVVPSQWPEERVEHLWTLLRARAIENQLFVAAANRAGRGGALRFGGYSAVIGPRGETCAECGLEEGAALAEIDLDEVSRVREEIFYLSDRVPAVDDLPGS